MSSVVTAGRSPEKAQTRHGTSFAAQLARRLLRTTASGEFIPEIDGLRCIAIAAVVLHHITASYLRTTRRFGVLDLPAQWWDVFPKSRVIAIGYAGHFGVPLFFVISGFILVLPFVRSYRQGTTKPHLGSYYLRRLVRLEAPYVVNVTIAFLLIVLTNVGWRTFIPHFAATLVYLHGPIFGQASWVNGVAWSLEVEVQFYIVMPVLAMVFAVRSRAARRILLVAAILVLAYLVQQLIHGDLNPRLQLSLLNYLHFFMAGFLLADLYDAHAARGFRRGWFGDALAVLAGASIYLILTRRYDLYYLTPVLIVVLYVGLFLGRVGHACITQPWAVAIGGMCYTVYLYHFMIIDLLARWTMSLASPAHALVGDFILQCVLLVPPIVLVSMVLYLLVEQPFMNLSRAVSRRFRSRLTTPSPVGGIGVRLSHPPVIDRLRLPE
ncbi:MAG: acyltransferase family protein [Candidatus Binatia bacterium]